MTSSSQCRATSRIESGDEMLRRYRNRMEVARVKLVYRSGSGTDPWMRCLSWQLAWENEIYRHGNFDNGKDNDDG